MFETLAVALIVIAGGIFTILKAVKKGKPNRKIVGLPGPG